MSVDAKFDVISYLKSITEPSTSGPVHPTTSAVRSWCYRHGEMLTMTKRGDSGKLVALAPESLRGEIYKQFTSRPRPREPRKRKAACLAPIEDVRLAARNCRCSICKQFFFCVAAFRFFHMGHGERSTCRQSPSAFFIL